MINDSNFQIQIKIGDTLFLQENRRFSPRMGKELKHYETPNKEDVKPLSDVSEAKCMVFACLYPSTSGDIDKLSESITRLQLTDASVQCIEIKSEALGQGFRCGFLGILHLEVFRQRLEDESGIQVLIAAPTITYKAVYRENKAPTGNAGNKINSNKITTQENGQTLIHIESPEDYPENPGVVDEFSTGISILQSPYLNVLFFRVFLFVCVFTINIFNCN